MRSALVLQGTGFFLLPGSSGCIGRNSGVFRLLVQEQTLFFSLRSGALLGLLFEFGTVLQALRAVLITLRPLRHARLPLQLLRFALRAALCAILLTLIPVCQTRLPLQLLLGGRLTPHLIGTRLFLLQQYPLLLRYSKLLLFDSGQGRAS